MRYVIMADGKGSRWNNYMGLDKHEIRIGGETLLRRTVRLLHGLDDAAEVIITSHNPALDTEGALRFEPANNVLEIDRFTAELVRDDMCFLYGDVFYEEETLRTVTEHRGSRPLLFFGNDSSICAVLIGSAEVFMAAFNAVRARAASGELPQSKGWQLYHQYTGMPLEGKAIGGHFIRVGSSTRDFNSPEDYRAFADEN